MPVWLLIVLYPISVALGLFATFALSLRKPLREMARLYPYGAFTEDRTYRRVGACLGVPEWAPEWAVSGRGQTIDLSLGKQGMSISPSFPFHRLAPRIFIPWSAVFTLQVKRSALGCDRLKIQVSQLPMPLWFSFLWRHGDAPSLIQKYWEESRANLPEKAAFQSNPA